MRTAIFTIDTESYEAKKKSAAGEALKRMLEQNRLEVKAAKVLPRDKEVVATVFRQLADSGSVELIITTGATGYLEQDCAPKAVEEVAEQLIPGIPEALRAYNLRYSKKAMLDCMAAGIRKNTLIVNLPESAKTAKEDMEYCAKIRRYVFYEKKYIRNNYRNYYSFNFHRNLLLYTKYVNYRKWQYFKQ